MNTPEDLQQRAVIDRSAKLPVLFFFVSGTLWLLGSCLLGFLASIAQHSPSVFDCALMNWGRLQPAFINAMVYGWGFQAAFGVMIWIMARLCRCPVKNPATVLIAGHAWNIGVTLGLYNIFSGQQAPGEWLEFGQISWLLLLVSFSIIAVWLVAMFVSRPKGADYVSQWYLIGACIWFPWTYITAQVFTHFNSGSGLHAAAVGAWYPNTLLALFFAPVAIGAAYYLVPKIVGRPIHSYQLATVGFWSLAILGGWTGMQKLVGTPLPAWMPAISGMAQILLLIPVICVGWNHFMTVRGHHGIVTASPTLRFTFFSAIFYVTSHLIGALLTLLARYTQFTIAQDAFQITSLYAYFTMAMFGAFYFIVPRLTGCEWLSGTWIRRHFWFNAYGSIALGILLLVGGLAQGQSIDTWNDTIAGAVENSRGYLVGRTVAWVFIGLSNLIFFFHLVLMVLRLGRRSEQATLLHRPEHETADVVITTEGAEA